MEQGIFPKKLYLKVQLVLLFLYLAFFPFGQVPHLLSQISDIVFFSSPADVVIIFSAILAIIYNFNYFIKKDYIFRNFIVFLIFSFIISIFTFGLVSTLNPGFLYLVRFISYLLFFKTTKDLTQNKLISKKLILNILVLIGLLIAISGLVQLIFLPDLRFLHVFGWDDHYYRLVSTFLDPAFTGIILVLSLILAVRLRFVFASLVLLTSLFLTYSRSSFFALFAVLIFIFLKNFKINRNIFFVLALALMLFLLVPKPGGEGVNLLRTASINFKIANFVQSVDIAKQYPLFGVGFNNICLVKPVSYFVYENHSCSGLDNSILFLIATTGVLGLLSFFDAILKLFRSIRQDQIFDVFVLSALAVFVHMQFTNTLFYPFVLGWFAILQS